jgi:GNAT superfamily N-acetyltransferase
MRWTGTVGEWRAAVIRKVRSDEAGRIVELLSQLWPDQDVDIATVTKILERYVQDPSYWIRGYQEDSALLGMITVSFRSTFFYGGEGAIIEDLVVEESHRGQGIGRELVGFVEDEIAEHGRARAVEVSSDLHRKGAHLFWEKCGYSRQACQFRKEMLRGVSA